MFQIRGPVFEIGLFILKLAVLGSLTNIYTDLHIALPYRGKNIFCDVFV